MRRVLFFFSLLLFSFCASGQVMVPLNYTTNIQRNPDSSKVYEFHVGHINFLNARGRFRKINTELTWRPLLKVWRMDSASYTCRIPEYADGLFTFSNNFNGSDYVLRASPMCAHVAGVLLANDGQGQSVLYADAFGAGIDLRVWATRHGLLKVITIKEKPASITADMYFDFQIVIPVEARLDAIRGSDGTLWDKESDLSFRDRVVKLGEAGKEVYFNPALVWDSAGRSVPVDIKLYKSGLKYYLRKTITKAFLETATYPVSTDHPTDCSPGAGDGFTGRSNGGSTWGTERGAPDAETFNYTASTKTYLVEAGNETGDIISLCRTHFPFNTEPIEDGATVTAATLKFYAGSKTSIGGSYDYVNVVNSAQASSTALVARDYSRVGTTKYSTDLAISSASLSTSGYTSMALNSLGIEAISKTGYSFFAMRTGWDIDNQSPSSGKYGNVQGYFSEYTGTDRDPKLEVTVSAGSYPGAMMFIGE